MKFVIQQNFTAQPFIGTGGIPLNTTPRDFVTGTTVDATEQMNFSRQIYWVTSDGYALDMSKVSAALNPSGSPVLSPASVTPGILNLQASQSFTALPFSFNSAVPSTASPKIFVAGQRIEARQQLNSLQQPFIVTTDGYVVDMSKVQQINYPLYQGYGLAPSNYPLPHPTSPAETPAVVTSAKTSGVVAADMFSQANLMKTALVVVILFIAFTMFKKATA